MTRKQIGKLKPLIKNIHFKVLIKFKFLVLLPRRKQEMSTTTEDSELFQLQTDLIELKVKTFLFVIENFISTGPS